MDIGLSTYDFTQHGDAQNIEMLDSKEEAILRDIEKFSGVKYSDEQLQVLRHKGGMCVLASAGSGKTTTITHLIAKRIKSGEIKDVHKVLCTTYSKTGADEMHTRLLVLLEKLGIKDSFTVKTMHAVYLYLLQQFGYKCAVIDSRTRNRFIIEACRENKVTLEGDDLQTLDSLFSYQINNLLTDEQLYNSYVFNLNMSVADYSSIRMALALKKSEKNLLDFDDMQMMVYNILRNPEFFAIRNWVNSLWTDFFIDEVQDISKIQYEILKLMVPDGANLVFIGDDDQCVYQWRGADPSIILNIPTFFSVKKFNLSTNYRCKGNIVDRAAVGIRNNSMREDKPIKAFNPGGTIRFCNCNCMDLYTMSTYGYLYIKKLVESGVKLSDIAVLARNNKQLLILGNMLFFGGFNYRLTSEMKITNNQVFRDFKTIISLVNGSYNHIETESILWKVCPYMRRYVSKEIASFQRDSGLSFYDTLGFILRDILNRGVKWDNPNVKIQSLVKTKLTQILSGLNFDAVTRLVEIFQILDTPDFGPKVKFLLDSYQSNVKFMYKSPESLRVLISLCKYFAKLVSKYDESKMNSLIKQTEIYEKAEMLQLGEKITLSTMHGAKGKEWKYVIIFADDNISFPSFYDISNMALTGVSQGDIWSSINENRRLHYVAMTRAKEELFILTDKLNMSVFTCEAYGLLGSNGGLVSNNSIITMSNSGGLYESIREGIESEIFSKEAIFIPGE